MGVKTARTNVVQSNQEYFLFLQNKINISAVQNIFTGGACIKLLLNPGFHKIATVATIDAEKCFFLYSIATIATYF